MQRWCFTAYVLTNDTDLFGGHIQLVAAFVRNEQIVPLDAADAALHHSFVLANAMMCVHHVATWLKVFKDCSR